MTTTSFRGWTLAARVLMAAIFLVAGVRKFMTYGATLGYFAKLGIPLGDVVLPLTIALEIGGGLLIAGWRLQWVASVLALSRWPRPSPRMRSGRPMRRSSRASLTISSRTSPWRAVSCCSSSTPATAGERPVLRADWKTPFRPCG